MRYFLEFNQCRRYRLFLFIGLTVRVWTIDRVELSEKEQLKRDLKEVVKKEQLKPDLKEVVSRVDWDWLFQESRPADATETHKIRTTCKSIMVALLRSANSELDRLQQRLAFHCAYHVRGIGVWDHHQQWGSIINPELRGLPIYSRPLTWWPELEVAIAELERSIPAMADEFLKARVRGTSNQKYLIKSGKWTGLQLLQPQKPPELSCLLKYPVACGALQQFSRALPHCRGGCLNLPEPYFEPYTVERATYNVLDPGSQILTHTSSDNQRIKLHCGILNPRKVTMKIGNQSLTWKRGVCDLIDDSFEHGIESSADAGQHPEHSAGSSGDAGQHLSPRVILELKITHPDFETSSQFVDSVSYWGTPGNSAPEVISLKRSQKKAKAAKAAARDKEL